MTASARHPYRTVLLVVFVLFGGVVLGGRVLDARERGAVEDAVHDAATSYVDLIATGGADDLERLWSMTASTEPAFLRAAGDLLVDADERMEVVEVGDPASTEKPRAGYQGVLEDFRAVVVTYRLADTERQYRLVLGRLEGRSGTSVEDWRVADPLTGSLGWTSWNPRATFGDFYVAGHLQEYPVQISSGGPESTQQLYPAVYGVEIRRDPWFDSPLAKVPVWAGAPVALQPMALEATDATVRETKSVVTALFQGCGASDRGSYSCPARQIVEDAGVETYDDRGWWRGLVKQPTITFDGMNFELTDGIFRFVGPEGVRRVRFNGSGVMSIDNGDQPYLSILTIQEVR